jgi:type I restriction enzyme S subunit
MSQENNTIKKTIFKTNIPDDWKVSLLDSLTKRGSGHTPDKEFDEYYDGGIKWISLADSYRLDKGLIFETDTEISELGIKKSSAVLHPAGTVLMSRDAGVGKSAVMGSDMAVSQHFIVWRCKEELNNWFLYYWLQYKKEYFERQAVGSTIKTIGLPLFKKLTIVHPQYSEQHAIAHILSLMDAAIDKNKQLITRKELQKKWLMQNLLTGKKRLKGFGGEWKVVAMANLFERVTRKNSEVNTNVVTISAQRGFVRQRDFFTKSIASEIIDNYFLVEKGEFCYNKSYSNGYPWGATKRLNDFDKAVVTTLYICFRLKNLQKSSGDFFEQYFEANLLDRGLTKIAHEGGRAHGLLNVTPSDFFSLKITIPNFEEQSAIAQVLQAADKEIQLLKTKTEKLREQKKGMMQQLLTGKKRLNYE